MRFVRNLDREPVGGQHLQAQCCQPIIVQGVLGNVHMSQHMGPNEKMYFCRLMISMDPPKPFFLQEHVSGEARDLVQGQSAGQ